MKLSIAPEATICNTTEANSAARRIVALVELSTIFPRAAFHSCGICRGTHDVDPRIGQPIPRKRYASLCHRSAKANAQPRRQAQPKAPYPAYPRPVGATPSCKTTAVSPGCNWMRIQLRAGKSRRELGTPADAKQPCEAHWQRGCALQLRPTAFPGEVEGLHRSRLPRLKKFRAKANRPGSGRNQCFCSSVLPWTELLCPEPSPTGIYLRRPTGGACVARSHD